MIVYWNGAFVQEEEVHISPWDLGFLRGYGVFDYLAVYDAVPFMIQEHFTRLKQSAEAIGISPSINEKEFISIVNTLVEENGLKFCFVRTVLTGGISTGGISKEGEPSLLIRTEIAKPLNTKIYTEGASLITIEYEREIPRAKTTHYIEALKNEKRLKEASAMEMLFVKEGVVLECSRSNIFLVSGENLITPHDRILLGITRGVVLEEAHTLGLIVEEREVHESELFTCDEVFITGTGKGIVPIVLINEIPISSGLPGQRTQELLARLNRRKTQHA